MLHWESCVTDNFLRMCAQASPEARVEILGRILEAFKDSQPQTPIDPGARPDMLPIAGSTVSVIRREFGRVVLTDREQAMLDAQHPHTRPDPLMNPRVPKKLPLGERFRP